MTQTDRKIILCCCTGRIYIVKMTMNSDYELLIAKFRLKLKKVGKTTRPFRYDLNQIPYNYIVEVTDRFMGLDLIDRVPEERSSAYRWRPYKY